MTTETELREQLTRFRDECLKLVLAQPFFVDTKLGKRQQWVKEQIHAKILALPLPEPLSPAAHLSQVCKERDQAVIDRQVQLFKFQEAEHRINELDDQVLALQTRALVDKEKFEILKKTKLDVSRVVRMAVYAFGEGEKYAQASYSYAKFGQGEVPKKPSVEELVESLPGEI